MVMMTKGYYIISNRDNGKEYKATVVPKVLVLTVFREMHDHFGHFGIGKTYSLIKRYYYWPKMIKHIQRHVDSCSLCRREKMQADKYQLQTTEQQKSIWQGFNRSHSRLTSVSPWQ